MTACSEPMAESRRPISFFGMTTGKTKIGFRPTAHGHRPKQIDGKSLSR